MEVKNSILMRARDMFLHHGFKSVTMDEIASAMGMSKKTLYNHYGNKTKLVEAVAMDIFQSICGGIDKIAESCDNPILELYRVKKFAMEHLKGESSSPIYQLQKYYPSVYDRVRVAQFDYVSKCMLRNLDRGIEMNLYRENLNPEFISRMYFVGVNAIKDLEVFPSNMFPIAQLHSDYLEYHLRGIVTPKGRKELNQIINSDLQ